MSHSLARLPPMGWMSWEIFRCDVDCKKAPADCIGERLYQSTADALITGGYVAAGYDTVHIDDCCDTQQDQISLIITRRHSEAFVKQMLVVVAGTTGRCMLQRRCS